MSCDALRKTESYIVEAEGNNYSPVLDGPVLDGPILAFFVQLGLYDPHADFKVIPHHTD